MDKDKENNSSEVNTGGGSYIGQSANSGGDFVGRDKYETNEVNTVYQNRASQFGSHSKRIIDELELQYWELALRNYDVAISETQSAKNSKPFPDQHQNRQLYIPLHFHLEDEVGTQGNKSRAEVTDRYDGNFSKAKLSEIIEYDENFREDAVVRVSVGTLLHQNRQLVILGDPGAGKSTLLRWIATCYLLRYRNDQKRMPDLPTADTLPDYDWLPVIIECRNAKIAEINLGGTLSEILRRVLLSLHMNEHDVDIFLPSLLKKFENGQAIWLIDGLDEIADIEQRAAFCENIEKIHIANRQTPIIVTSRIFGYEGEDYRIQRGFQQVKITDLSIEEKDEYVKSWCRVHRPEKWETAAKKLISEIHEDNKWIERLTVSPLLLSMVIRLWSANEQLPKRRFDLYQESINLLLRRAPYVSDRLTRKEVIPKLSYIAYVMCKEDIYQISEDKLLRLLATIEDDGNYRHLKSRHPDDFLYLVKQTAILKEKGKDHIDNIFEFQHRTFQEYLAGYALATGYYPSGTFSNTPVLAKEVSLLASPVETKTRSGERKLDTNQAWREAIRLCVAACTGRHDTDRFLRAILTPLKNEEPYLVRKPRAILAASCLADDPDASDEVATEIIQVFVKQIDETDGSGSTQMTALDNVAVEIAKANSRWLDLFRNALINEYRRREVTKRIEVAGLCGMVTSASVRKGEVEEWLTAQVQNIRNGGNSAIGAIVGIMQLAYEKKNVFKPEIVDELMNALDSDDASAMVAAWALYWLSDQNLKTKAWRPSVDQINKITILIKNQNFDSTAVRFLSLVLRRPIDLNLPAVQALVTRLPLKNDTINLKMILGTLKVLKHSEAVHPLIDLLTDEDAVIKRSAIDALGSIGHKNAVKPLVEELKKRNIDVIETVIQALGDIGDSEAIESLIDLLKDSEYEHNSWLQAKIIEALGKLGIHFESRELIVLLMNKLENPNNLIRQHAALALSQICSELKDSALRRELMELLIACLKIEKNSWVQECLIRALGLFRKNSLVVDVLCDFLDSSNRTVRDAAIRSLGETRSSNATEKLIAQLDNDDSANWIVLLEALGRMGGPRAVNCLREKLKDQDAQVRRCAILALGKIKSGEVEHDLRILMFSDMDVVVRRNALDALSSILGRDRIERKLLSRDLDGELPLIDPKQIIEERIILQATEKLKLSSEEVRRRYEALAETFNLRVAWKPQFLE